MTFLSRRKRQTTLHASPTKWGATIISAIVGVLAVLPGARGQTFITPQNNQVIMPNFAPANPRGSTGLVPVAYPAAQGKNGAQPRRTGSGDDGTDVYIPPELPGPQRMFIRESEVQFYDRIRQEGKKQVGAGPAIFPEEKPISTEKYTSPSYPRIDPLLRQPVAQLTETVEPFYVCHRRLLFEQPNFERIGWDFGIMQPGLHVGIFYYDLVMAPYHFSSNLSERSEGSAGKCLPGDPAPFTVPIERFSVTGVIGEAAVLIGGLYLFPHP